ncbi:MAG: carboxypeptidase-like regulatory domain-containing protein [Holophagales bacterium]|nr:carboxypeptidase-like regulatory domain-containing protein [Holophagales bacterium]
MRFHAPRILLAACISLAGLDLRLSLPAAADSREDVSEFSLAVYGRVLDPEGEPLAGVAVTLRPLPSQYDRGLLLLSGSFRTEPVAETRTGSHGWFQLEAPEVGFYRLTLDAKGFLPMSWDFDPLLHARNLEPIRLTVAETLAVRVVEAGGKPLPGARVRLDELPSSSDCSHTPETRGTRWRPGFRIGRTDRQGRVEMPFVDRSHVHVRILSEEIRFGNRCTRSMQPSPALTLSPCIPGEKGCWHTETRRLRVVDAAGRGLPGRLISFDRAPVAVTDGEGWVEVPADVSSKTLNLRAADGLEWSAQADAGGLLLEPDAARIEGRVVEAASGRGIAGALVWNGARFTHTDARGAFSWRRTESRGSSLRAARTGYGKGSTPLADPSETAAVAAERVLIELRPERAIRGRVVDAEGAPVPGAEVSIRKWSRGHALRLDRRNRILSGPDGSFTFAELQPELTYQVGAFHPSASAALGLASPSTSFVELVLEEGGTLRGRLIDEQGQPIAGGSVELFDQAGVGENRLLIDEERHSAPPVLSEKDGSFLVRGVAQSRQLALFTASGYVSRGVSGITGEASLDLGEIRLEAATSMPIRVMNPDGAPIAGARLRVHQLSFGRFWSTPGADLTHMAARRKADLESDQEGLARVGIFTEGTPIKVELEHPDYLRGELEAEIGPATLEHVLHPALQITGLVYDTEGRPIRAAKVWAEMETSTGPESAGSTSTGEDGSFALRRLKPGKLRVLADGPGFVSENTVVDLSDGESREDLRFELSTGLAVRGRVVASGVEDLSGTRVFVSVRVAPPRSSEGSSGEVDEQGRFEITGLPSGPAKVDARHLEHGEASLEFDMGPGMPEVTLRLERKPSLIGRVVDESGQPVVLARYVVAGNGELFMGRATAEGRFGASLQQPGVFTLTLWKENMTEVRREIEVGAVATHEIEIVLPAGAILRGRIEGLTPEELQRVRLVAAPENVQSPPELWLPRAYRYRNGAVDYGGSYRVEGLAAGAGKVHAMVSGTARTASAEVEVHAGVRELSADLVFDDPGHTLEGQVLHNGLPAAGVEIWPGPVVADSGGHFRVEGLETGPYRMEIRGPWGMYLQRGELRTADFVTVEIETRRVRGRLLDSDGLPVPGARIGLSKTDGSYEDWGSVETDKAGEFQMPSVLVGSYELFARKGGLGAISRRLEIHQDIEGLELRLRRTSRLTVRASRADGKAIEALHLTVSGEDGLTGGSEREKIGVDGLFHFDEVPRGSWNLAFDCNGCVQAFIRATLPGEPLEVLFEPAAELEVKVPSLAESRARAELHIRDAEGLSVPFRPAGSTKGTWPVYGGRVILSSLPAGTWRLEVRADDGRTFTGQATTTPETTTVVELR